MIKKISLLLMLIATPVWAIEVYDFETPEQEALYQQLAKDLRCLVCQNQNLADSEAGLAKDLKDQVAEFVMAGQDAETIKQYMIERYGDFVTYNPPMNLGTAFLWFSPLVVFLIGSLVLFLNIRRKQHD
ncbi:cytochrome c-type biogenesis protein CcmH [Marinicella sp. S1101]|jgi:cytochrome c-type biogenesis protein CcmH|uniref:cytochrome c-type biogenesis protein n=1 Tax=Marinicella marina TaxID=2996016 RepID=UPI002260BDDF|nr:cytochrome c-type biogenesis protein [Marinicella marina]MCX7554510.1 cytochrome c-type biogenesis protein CcmH [Marinicella marina]MDJ1140661.1 cytochrome c-type biogenesis protein CcmH [Marinicella marina]